MNLYGYIEKSNYDELIELYDFFRNYVAVRDKMDNSSRTFIVPEKIKKQFPIESFKTVQLPHFINTIRDAFGANTPDKLFKSFKNERKI